MRLIATIGLMLLMMGSAHSQKFTHNTVFMAVQCDIGRFAETAKRVGLDPAMMASIEFSWKVETSTKVESSASLKALFEWLFKGPSVRAARQWTKSDENKIKGTFNVHEDNTEACQTGVLKIPLGIRDCLMESTEVLRRGADASCNSIRAVQGTLSADGKIVIWSVIEAGASAEYDIKATYTIATSAPTREDSKSSRTSALRSGH